jgi:hypothetical protein
MFRPLFDGTILSGATKYIGLPMGLSSLEGIQISRITGAGADTITLEMSLFPADQAPVATAGTYQWKDSGETISTPTAGTSTLVHLGNIGTTRSRLKIVAAADARYIIRGTRKL